MIEVKKIEKSFDITIDNIASDKSISHRCAIFALLSDRPSIIKNYLIEYTHDRVSFPFADIQFHCIFDIITAIKHCSPTTRIYT